MDTPKSIVQLTALASTRAPSPADAAALLIDAAAMHWSNTGLPLFGTPGEVTTQPQHDGRRIGYCERWIKRQNQLMSKTGVIQ